MEEPVFPSETDSFIASSLDHPSTSNGRNRSSKSSAEQYLYVFSANDRESLKRHISLVAEYVKERPVTLYPQLPRSLAFTLGQRRSILPWKFAGSYFSSPIYLFTSQLGAPKRCLGTPMLPLKA